MTGRYGGSAADTVETAMISDSYEVATEIGRISSNGSAPRCDHGDSLAHVVPQAATCRECEELGSSWQGLVVCLTCGWVACSDDSPRRHALAHYEETDHPVTAELVHGWGYRQDRRWCYVHRRAI